MMVRATWCCALVRAWLAKAPLYMDPRLLALVSGSEMDLMVFPGATWAKSGSNAMTSVALLLAAAW